MSGTSIGVERKWLDSACSALVLSLGPIGPNEVPARHVTRAAPLCITRASRGNCTAPIERKEPAHAITFHPQYLDEITSPCRSTDCGHGQRRSEQPKQRA